MTRPSFQDYGTYDESAHSDLWDGVVGYWAPCLGPTGTRLFDVSRFNNWGTLTNMDAATDWVINGGQYALDFDGSNDLVVFQKPALIPQSGATAFTVCSWVQLRQSYAKLLDANVTTGLIIYVATSGALSNGIWVGVGTTFPIVSSASKFFTANRWGFCSVVFNDKNVRLFIDGKLEGTGTSAQFPNFSTSQWRVGGTGGAETTNGLIDDFAIWNRALTDNEVARLYNLGRGGMLERRRRRRVYSVQADVVRSYLFTNRGQVIGGGTL